LRTGYQNIMRRGIRIIAIPLIAFASSAAAQDAYDALIAKHAAANGVPESLVRRVIKIESRGNPRLVSHGNYGLMQIRLGTARAMGYSGTAEGLLDPGTNMTYAVKYLAGAYRAAGGDHDRAISNYQRGYYTRTAKSSRSSAAPPASLAGLQSAQPSDSPPVPKLSPPPAAHPAPQPVRAASLTSLAGSQAAQSPGAQLAPKPNRPPVAQRPPQPARAAKPARTGKTVGAPLNLLSFLKNLVSPAKTPHKRGTQAVRQARR
jgi:hypothetical protein